MNDKLIHFKNTSCKEAAKLVENDLSFSVLYNILHFNCTDIFTNNKSIVICYSNYPYPIWVWVKDINNQEDVNTVKDCLKNYYLLKGDYNIIIEDELLSKLCECDDYFKNTKIKMDLLSYRLDNLVEISYDVDGYFGLAKIEDLDYLAVLFKDMYYEMEHLEFSIEECKNKVIDHINKKTLYVWYNGLDEIVCLTSKGAFGEYSKISSVYTLPNKRRKGYAINLVYQVSKIIKQEGLTPVLYTDGSYIASNECYKKIGFYQVGRLVNFEKDV